MHAKVFSIQIYQYIRQIPPRVCTLVLFIFIGSAGQQKLKEANIKKAKKALETLRYIRLVASLKIYFSVFIKLVWPNASLYSSVSTFPSMPTFILLHPKASPHQKNPHCASWIGVDECGPVMTRSTSSRVFNSITLVYQI